MSARLEEWNAELLADKQDLLQGVTRSPGPR